VTPRARKSVAVLCIVLVVVAGVLPAVALALGTVLLVALWFVLPAVVATIVRRRVCASTEQSVSLLALIDSRGPPRAAVLA
jgi:hypothetical protein